MRRRGIFSAAYDTLAEDDLDPHVAERMRADLEWFSEHLAVPKLAEPRAIFLFKTGAKECMRHVWSLLHGLRDAGVFAEMQTFANPGRIVYEDKHQVAVMPWVEERGL